MTEKLLGSAKQPRAQADVMMRTRTDRVDVINDERQRSCLGARSNPAHRPSRCNDEDDSDSHSSDDRRWKMNSKDEKEEEDEEEEEKDGAKEAADNQFDDSE